MVKSAINVALRTILVLVADPKRMWDKAGGIAENPAKAGVLRHVTDPVEADVPLQGHDLEVDHRHETPTA